MFINKKWSTLNFCTSLTHILEFHVLVTMCLFESCRQIENDVQSVSVHCNSTDGHHNDGHLNIIPEFFKVFQPRLIQFTCFLHQEEQYKDDKDNLEVKTQRLDITVQK